ncbi:helix-turn-helix domain-containing protein [Labrys neptuniae]|uniref:Helix-turn-helix domain-containing protein n=1 Tax=Labrys neptuniae TaxID=376174 RepID=A0ABV3PQH8_9HYPH
MPSDIDLPEPSEETCRPFREILDRVGDKWTLLVIAKLNDGPLRFNEIKRRIGCVSQRMLTLTLRGLERDGLLTRTTFATIPPRVDYELTEVGRGLFPAAKALVAWAYINRQAIDQARAQYDQSHEAPSGPPLIPAAGHVGTAMARPR